jgi:hypothetical protein
LISNIFGDLVFDKLSIVNFEGDSLKRVLCMQDNLGAGQKWEGECKSRGRREEP